MQISNSLIGHRVKIKNSGTFDDNQYGTVITWGNGFSMYQVLIDDMNRVRTFHKNFLDDLGLDYTSGFYQ